MNFSIPQLNNKLSVSLYFFVSMSEISKNTQIKLVKRLKNINGLVDIAKDKKHSCCWQNGTIHAYKKLVFKLWSLTKSGSCLLKLKTMDEHKERYCRK